MAGVAKGDRGQSGRVDFRVGALVGRDADQTFAIAEKVGANEILFWEADYIDDRPNAAELKTHLRIRAANCLMKSDLRRQ
jgi:hypothetical protein